MVSIQKIFAKIQLIDENLTLLRRMAATPVERYTTDKVLIGSSRYYLQISIEACLDIANHVISAERYRAPRDYADSFKVLEEEDVLDQELTARLQKMAKFRNRLVHLYGEIDDAQVHRMLRNELPDFEHFTHTILKRFA